ncbi:MAG TPA: hypothetical protein PLH03_06135 [Methylophilaceae bacterium]|nr:hypothetical protein [Methylophilaceae bacterium]
MQFLIAVMLLPLLLIGCAANGTQPPKIERISAEDLERLMPRSIPNLTLEQIVEMSQRGVAPDEIIAKIRESQSGYALIPSQVIVLAGRGVSPKVLDYIHAAHEEALRDACADEINRRDQVCRDKLDVAEQQLMWSSPCWGPYWGPYWAPYPPGYYRYWPRPY